jgi:hypothetical protein
MFEKVAVIGPVPLTVTVPADEYHTLPASWLGGFDTVINALPVPKPLAEFTKVYVPGVGAEEKQIVIVVLVLVLTFEIHVCPEQPGLVHAAPTPTPLILEFCCVEVVAIVPVVVTFVIFGLPPVPLGASSL